MNTATALHQPAAAAKPLPRRDHVIAVASGKGGVGKTWLAITLAQSFARRGLRTLLFDGDLGLANIDIQLGLMPLRDLGEVLSGGIAMENAITRYDDGGFDVIAGKSGSGSLATLPAVKLLQLREDLLALSAKYDRVVIDLGAGLDQAVRLLAAASGTTLIVANDEPTSLTDAYAFIKLTLTENPTASVRIVVNMAGSQREGERTYAKLLRACQSFLNATPPLVGVVRRDLKVREAIRNQIPLLTRHPGTTAAQDVEGIAERLIMPRFSR
jgi:flagellar biosynthesis protein FlhG